MVVAAVAAPWRWGLQPPLLEQWLWAADLWHSWLHSWFPPRRLFMSRCSQDRTSGSFTREPGMFSLELLSLPVLVAGSARESKLSHCLRALSRPFLSHPTCIASYQLSWVFFNTAQGLKWQRDTEIPCFLCTAFVVFPANKSNSAGYSSPCDPPPTRVVTACHHLCGAAVSPRSLPKLPSTLWRFFGAVLVLLQQIVLRSRSQKLFSFPVLRSALKCHI